MTWKEIGPYRGYLLWVRELPTEGWVVGMVPDRTAPEGARRPLPPVEDQVLPEAFPSEVAAVAAAMRFIERRQLGRAERRDP